MADTVDAQTRSRIMARVKSKNTTPELFVRRAVHAQGHRYRLYRKDLPGCPDLVFPKYKMVVFIHGCFWHWHGCSRSRMPSSNQDYWTTKISRNVERDKKARMTLKADGWKSLVIWECELKEGTQRLLKALGRARSNSQE